MKDQNTPTNTLTMRCEMCNKVHEVTVSNLVKGSKVRIVQCPNDLEEAPTNTPDPIEMLYIESPSITLKQFREAIAKEVSQAVNKARTQCWGDFEFSYYNYLPPHAKLDFDNSKPSELNRDETPKQVEGFVQVNQTLCNICKEPQQRVHRKCKEK